MRGKNLIETIRSVARSTKNVQDVPQLVQEARKQFSVRTIRKSLKVRRAKLKKQRIYTLSSEERPPSVSSERSVLEEADSFSEEDMEPPKFDTQRREESKPSRISRQTKGTRKSGGTEKKVWDEDEINIASS